MHIAFLQQGIPSIEIPFAGWIVLWLIFSVMYALLWPIIIKYIFRVDFSAISNIDLSELRKEKQTMLPEQKFGVGVLLGFVVAMFIPQIFPENWLLTRALSTLGLGGCLAIAVVVMVAFKKSDGTHYLTMQSAANGISWNVIWLLVATEPLASAFNSEECGILPSIMTTVTPWLTMLSPAVFLAICMIVLGLITQFVHNMVLIVVFIPILCPLYIQMGGNPFVMFLGLVVAMNAAFTTPAASWNSAMMFGVDGTITSKVYLHGFLHFIFSLVVFFVIAMPLANILLPY